MESQDFQHKLDAAKKHMNEVKKKKRVNSSINNQDLNENVSVSLESSETISSPVTNKPMLETVKEDPEIYSKSQIKEKILNQVNIQDVESSKFMENVKSLEEDIVTKLHSKKTVLNDSLNPSESIRTLQNEVNELKLRVSLLEKNYHEINDKLNIILSKIQVNNALFEEKKEAGFIDNERINQLEMIVEDLKDKLEKSQEKQKILEASPKIICQTNPQTHDDLSFEDISLNTTYLSPIVKNTTQIYHETCKIDLKKIGGCAGCIGDIFEV
ncbi:hypothetical protein PNEG_00054 [Pneumocystis murina B123]|uniref:Uncharacterized protein n=1 Tax=Pneumocystis murina (strain B123) TaxID=1069680 RepID=M7NS82_PNEMU|nr:hypothetical protein PNEG_00054 [Pneumocystis murina B123]EMR11613.1 hypothetical protein PNEG_00054 [Pneumocystis murina B123]